MIEIVPSIFIKKNVKGDFFWEIATDLEPATLYIFNDDDQYHSLSFPNNEKGNAVIKRWNK